MKIQFSHIAQFLKRKVYSNKPAQSILGTQKSVNAFGTFYMHNKDELIIAGAGLIHSFVAKNKFTPEQLIAYKRAVHDYGKIFSDAYDERTNELDAQKKDRVNPKNLL